MKKLLFLITFTLFILRSLGVGGPTQISAQSSDPDYQCIGSALAKYMNAVIVEAGNLSNVKLLTPAFNMTSYTFEGIIAAMDQAEANWPGLDGLAGNIYRVDNQSIANYLNEKISQMPNGVQGLPIHLTETGNKDLADKLAANPSLPRSEVISGLETLGADLDKIKPQVQSALLFNVFNTNKGFASFAISPTNISSYLCGPGCGKIGVNYAEPFPGQAGKYYDEANKLSMQSRLAIATIGSEPNIKAAIEALPNSGSSIIIRIGNMTDSGGFSDPTIYTAFLSRVNRFAQDKGVVVYAIAGPNEPETESWASPNCKLTPITKNGPLEEGFYPQTYSCTGNPANLEYHPLRPYPGSPCDPLIPRSIPEAKDDAFKKYNTFACGSSLTPSSIERFDPYGKNGLYESLSVDVGGQTFAHTICNPVADNAGGSTTTCYRSSAFDLNLDLSRANLGILGNTQDSSLTDAQKVNEYLSWYLTGTPQIGDQLPVNPDSQQQIDRVINYSGPLRKLLPYDLTNLARSTVANTVGTNVHNYVVGCAEYKPVDYIQKVAAAILQAYGDVFNNDIEAIQKIATIIVEGGSFNQALEIALEFGEGVVKNFGAIWEAGQKINAANIAQAIACEENSSKTRLSDYSDSFANGLIKGALGNLNFIRDDLLVKLVQNIPFSSMEDIAGEVTLSVFKDPTADQQSIDVKDSYSSDGKTTVPLQLRIIKADLIQP